MATSAASLGLIYIDLGDYERAFQYFAQTNYLIGDIFSLAKEKARQKLEQGPNDLKELSDQAEALNGQLNSAAMAMMSEVLNAKMKGDKNTKYFSSMKEMENIAKKMMLAKKSVNGRCSPIQMPELKLGNGNSMPDIAAYRKQLSQKLTSQFLDGDCTKAENNVQALALTFYQFVDDNLCQASFPTTRQSFQSTITDMTTGFIEARRGNIWAGANATKQSTLEYYIDYIESINTIEKNKVSDYQQSQFIKKLSQCGNQNNYNRDFLSGLTTKIYRESLNEKFLALILKTQKHIFAPSNPRGGL